MSQVRDIVHAGLMVLGVLILWGGVARAWRRLAVLGFFVAALGLLLFVRDGRMRRHAARRLDEIRAEQRRRAEGALKKVREIP